MTSSLPGQRRRIADWLRRRAENVAVLLLAVMFLAFIAQIVFRYVLNLPTGWTSELTVICWLWLILWGAAFVVRERDEIRFDLVYGAVRPGVRRWMAIAGALSLIVLYVWSLPAVWDYVTFMKVQQTAYLRIRYDLLYAIYIIFVVAIIARYVWLLWTSLRGRAPDVAEPGSGGGSL